MSLFTGSRYNLLFYLLFLSCFHGLSQSLIKGVIVDSAHVPVPFCAAAILNAKDSSLVKGSMSDDNGRIVFEGIRQGSYLVKLMNAGFQPLIKGPFHVDSLSPLTLDTLQMKSSGIQLKEVSVSVFKQSVEFKKGAVVLNVENNILAAGNTVLELLRRLPGVTVDAQNNVSISGRSDVRFMIDGRLQQIPLDQVVTLLSGMPAESVSSIELIRNPPAKYDAVGSAGLINIVMKKAKLKGVSGSVSQSISQGVRTRSGTTASLNFKSNRLSVFSNLSYYNLMFETNNHLENRIGDFQTLFNGRQLYQREVANANGGLEYELDKKTILGINASINPSRNVISEHAHADISGQNPFAYDRLNFVIDSRQKVVNPTASVSASRKLDTLGSQLQLYADVTDYRENSSKYIQNYFSGSGSEVQPPNFTRTTFDNDFRIYTQKLDLNKQFKKSVSVEAGLKSSFANTASKALVELTDTLTRQLLPDTNFSNRYVYQERILAGYATLAKSIKKFDLKAGLRAEQTYIDASNAPKPFRLHRNYINFFPSGSVDYKLNAKHSFQASYSYRIDRPRYDQLNPTRVYNDQLHYGSGNPTLKPQYSHFNELRYNYNNLLMFTAGYYRTTGFMYYYFYGDPKTKITVDTIFNYGKRNNFMLDVFMQKQVKWLNVQLYGFVMYRTFRGEVNGLQANSATFHYYGNFNIEIMLPKAVKLQLNGFYNSRFHDGVQIYYPNGVMDIGISRSFLNKKLNLSMSLYDVFYTARYPSSNGVGDQYSYYTERTDTRRIRFYVVYKFGKMKIDQQLKGDSGSKKRLKNAD